MLKRYGLIFKIENQCWLTEYFDGQIEDASPLSDDNEIYKELNPRELVLVEIFHEKSTDGGEIVSIQDLRTITVRNDNNPEKTVADLVLVGDLPELAKTIFEKEDF